MVGEPAVGIIKYVYLGKLLLSIRNYMINRVHSSMVEQRTFNPLALGSSPNALKLKFKLKQNQSLLLKIIT